MFISETCTIVIIYSVKRIVIAQKVFFKRKLQAVRFLNMSAKEKHISLLNLGIVF